MIPLNNMLTIQPEALQTAERFPAGIILLIFIGVTTWFTLNLIIGTFTSIIALGFQLEPHRVIRIIYFIIITLLLIVYIWFFIVTSTTILSGT